jgi:hypothetical protein
MTKENLPFVHAVSLVLYDVSNGTRKIALAAFQSAQHADEFARDTRDTFRNDLEAYVATSNAAFKSGSDFVAATYPIVSRWAAYGVGKEDFHQTCGRKGKFSVCVDRIAIAINATAAIEAGLAPAWRPWPVAQAAA